MFLSVQRIVNCSVLTQTVPRINLIKISHSQVNIFILLITFVSEEFQFCCHHNADNVGHTCSTE